MAETKLDRVVIFLLRVLVGWTFLYAGSWQILQNYSAGGFLNHVVTFHDFFAAFATDDASPDRLPDEVGSFADRIVAGLRVYGPDQRSVWHPPHDHLPLRPHGLAVHRRSSQSLRRFPPRLRDRDCLPNGSSRRPR